MTRWPASLEKSSLGRLSRASRGLLLAYHRGRCCFLCSKVPSMQLNNYWILASAVELHSLSTHWPFLTWTFDLIGPINRTSQCHIWILAVNSAILRWVEAGALNQASRAAIPNFFVIMSYVVLTFLNVYFLVMALLSTMHMSINHLNIMVLIM